MTVKELIEELEYYDPEGQVIFEVDEDFRNSTYEMIEGGFMVSIHVDQEVEPYHVSDYMNDGNCHICLGEGEKNG